MATSSLANAPQTVDEEHRAKLTSMIDHGKRTLTSCVMRAPARGATAEPSSKLASVALLSRSQMEFFDKHGVLLLSGRNVFESQAKLEAFVADAKKVTQCQERMDGPWMYYNMQKTADAGDGQDDDEAGKGRREAAGADREDTKKDASDDGSDDGKNDTSDDGSASDTGNGDGDASDAGSDGGGRGRGRILSRIEKFCDHYPAMRAALMGGGVIQQMISQLFGEPAALYKEKINLKLPGDSGFEAHQDHAAGWWAHGHSIHVNAFVALDPCSVANGALQCTLGWGGLANRELVSERFKGVPRYCEEAFAWYDVVMESGDVLFFTSFVPHRSAVNTTELPRRVLLGTWNKVSEGDRRDDYYADKEKSFPPDIKRLAGDKRYVYKI